MPAISRPPISPDDPHAGLFAVAPPAGPAVHRGWSVWYDHGLYQTGITYRETKWWAQSPAGDQLQADGYDDILDAVDQVIDLLGGQDAPRLPRINPA